MGKASDKIIIRDMIVVMSVGIHAFEKENLQRVIVNVEMTVRDNPRWKDDDINNVVSYADIVERIEFIAKSQHMNLVETFAEYIAAAVLENDQIADVRVRVEKPDIFESVAGVGVEIIRSR